MSEVDPIEARIVAAQRVRGFESNSDLVGLLETMLGDAKSGLMTGFCVVTTINDRKTGELLSWRRCNELKRGIEAAYEKRDEVYDPVLAHHPGRGRAA